MKKKPCALVWLRDDLRLSDHPAIHIASIEYQKVAIVATLDPQENLNERQIQWKLASIDSLGVAFKKGKVSKTLFDVAKRIKASALIWCEGKTPKDLLEDQRLKQGCIDANIEPIIVENNYLIDPKTCLSRSQTPFKKFSAFKHAAQKEIKNTSKFSKIPKSQLIKISSDSCKSKSFDCPYWIPGEAAAQKRMANFIKNDLKDYHKNRDDYTIAKTSMLSVHLRFGEISIHELVNKISSHTGLGKEVFFSELLWREFSYYLLVHFPYMTNQPFASKFKKFAWKHQPTHFKKWKEGKTGYPVIDAAMRELKETGWMHNRLRMLVASFLSKHLLIHWTKGERYFAEQLMDFDLANNLTGWQWSAGQGIDQAPYFRIFNPVIQSKKFDPEGEYIKKWVPELSELTKREIHEPYQFEETGLSYPDPIVNHKKATKEALAAYKKL